MVNVEKEIKKKFPKLDLESSFINKSLISLAKKVVHEDSINEFLQTNAHKKGFEFVDAVLDNFDFDYTVSSNDIQNIPSSGKVVIIANHPLGGLDALCLLKLVGKVRKDVKIVANDFLAGIEALSSLFVPIDNYKRRQSKKDIKAIYDALNNDEAIIIFPAGEVSRATPKGIKDPMWSKGFLSFAQHCNAPILPILVDGKNSKIFYTISILNKTFSTLLLSHEMFKKKSKKISIKIGEIIPNENIMPKGINKRYLLTLYKKHLYALKKGKKSFFVTQKAIAHPEKRQDIMNELKSSKIIGETADGKIIYLYNYTDDSIVLKELGRLRELSFRSVGEGINKKRDTDKYDIYYEHIILWDREALEIVGSYRIGNGEFINNNLGISGFYSSTLFEYKDEFLPYLNDSIELGRSFVQPKYWGSRALDYLWYGIGAYLKTYPQIKYMYGPVSISASLPKIAKDMLVFYYSHYYSSEKNLLESKIPYQYSIDLISLKAMFELNDKKTDFKILKTALSNMGIAVPTLYKQYSELCEEGGVNFQGFNVDPDFSNCVDGLIVVEINKVKDKQKSRYMK
ncbi:phospholipid/glycerol acyltransferase [Arcobacter nitrofigilis DSM 7299]|uniref:Phospholipid/glycerol acyltransferase n=1 Tax=Arcobacter nitrofigilis (strain ATCC 33309 / DSM 7299 / CCUG 15893 / LMG 7604 / NCTC 12251 / CI) TaxID=572480 RepID=D5V296_ARCNC|nr:lysophospholipid acyltransferase family protein [Arcobacter nitrofigilis]ADG92329.1 phospholipid/glycerol acyltransferase [Arcobacter nitrofigilis DSM 7299]